MKQQTLHLFITWQNISKTIIIIIGNIRGEQFGSNENNNNNDYYYYLSYFISIYIFKYARLPSPLPYLFVCTSFKTAVRVGRTWLVLYSTNSINQTGFIVVIWHVFIYSIFNIDKDSLSSKNEQTAEWSRRACTAISTDWAIGSTTDGPDAATADTGALADASGWRPSGPGRCCPATPAHRTDRKTTTIRKEGKSITWYRMQGATINSTIVSTMYLAAVARALVGARGVKIDQVENGAELGQALAQRRVAGVQPETAAVRVVDPHAGRTAFRLEAERVQVAGVGWIAHQERTDLLVAYINL